MANLSEYRTDYESENQTPVLELDIKIPTKEDAKVGPITVIIAGNAGSGKTSIGNTASNPLHINADNEGWKRSLVLVPKLDVIEWQHAAGIIDPKNTEKLEGFDTIVVDTIGRLIEVLCINVARRPKCGQRDKITLTQLGWGVVRRVMIQWLNHIRYSMGKNIVLLSHTRVDDEKNILLDVPGGSNSEILKSADFIGMLYNSKETGKFVLDFSRTAFFPGKNAGNIPPTNIPNLKKSPFFLSHLLEEMKQNVSQQVYENLSTTSVLASYREIINAAKSATDLNQIFNDLQKNKDENLIAFVKWMLADTAKKLGFEYKKDVGKFE